MKKETIKNIILYVLVISSVVLTFNIWTYQKLWPDGYNFFSNIAKLWPFSSGAQVRSGSLSKEKLALPEKIIVNNAAARGMYFESSPEYAVLIDDMKEIFIPALQSQTFDIADPAEWNAALKAKSMYISYPVLYDMQIASDILNVDKPRANIKTINDFIISLGDLVSSNLIVYIKDYSDMQVYKCAVKYDKKEFEAILERYANLSTGELPYSFELNFDKRTPDAPNQKTTIDPGVLITLNRTMYNTLTHENPIFNETAGEFNLAKCEAFLKKFGYNINTVRKYPEDDGAIVYVENYGTIRVTHDGLFEYRAVAREKGIDLGVSVDDGFNKIFAASLNFVTELWNDVLPETEINLGITSDVVNLDNNSFKLTMNHYSNGVLIRDDITKQSEPMIYAVEMIISDAKIVSYRQIFRIYRQGDTQVDNLSTIEALDIVFNQGLFEITDSIKDLTPAYTFANGACNMTWVVKNQEDKSVIIRR